MEKVVIIGGGPAGLSAAIYLARAGLKPLIFAGSPPGGQLMLTSQVENYPGFESVIGGELIKKMRKQAKKFGAKILDQNISKVDLSRSPFRLYLPESYKQNKSEIRNPKPETNPNLKNSNLKNSKIVSKFDIRASNLYLAKSIIIATGAKALWLGLPSEKRLLGKGVSACAICDGFFFRDKTVAVVGGGDTALEEALTLTKFAKKVYLIHRRDQFRASKILQERVGVGHDQPGQIKNGKIEIIWNAVVEEIVGENRVDGIKLKVKSEKLKVEIQNLKLEGVFVAIGHKPDTEVFKGKIALDDKGYIITSARKAIDNSKFLINLISNKAPSANDPKLGIGNLLGQLDQLVIRNYKYDYQSAASIPGVFAAGDCVDYQYRQVAVAAGMGVAAALELEKCLEDNN